MKKRIVRLTESQLYTLIKEALITEMGRLPKPREINDKTNRKKILDTFRQILSQFGFKSEYVALNPYKNSLEANDIPPHSTLWEIFQSCMERDINKRNELIGGFTEKKRDIVIKIIAAKLDVAMDAIELLWKRGVDAMFSYLYTHNFAIDKRKYRDMGVIV